MDSSCVPERAVPVVHPNPPAPFPWHGAMIFKTKYLHLSVRPPPLTWYPVPFLFILKINNMKHVKMLTKLLFSAALLTAVSCNSGNDKKETAADSTAPMVVVAPPSLPDRMTIKHKVANFAKWKAAYETHDSARTANGLHNYVVARGVEDSNMVLIALGMDDADKAKAFSNSEDLKATMKKAGVTGAPEIDYLHSVINDTTGIQQTVRLMVKHKVKDWDAWKKIFDEHKQTRSDAGLTDRVVAHTVGDNHHVTLVFAVADMAKAKAFMNSKDLADRMKAGGVDGPPSFFFYRIVQKF